MKKTIIALMITAAFLAGCGSDENISEAPKNNEITVVTETDAAPAATEAPVAEEPAADEPATEEPAAEEPFAPAEEPRTAEQVPAEEARTEEAAPAEEAARTEEAAPAAEGRAPAAPHTEKPAQSKELPPETFGDFLRDVGDFLFSGKRWIVWPCAAAVCIAFLIARRRR